MLPTTGFVGGRGIGLSLLSDAIFEFVSSCISTVIASEAKQSIASREGRMDCFVADAPRNDGESPTQTFVYAIRSAWR
jgi:hypothetical protein